MTGISYWARDCTCSWVVSRKTSDMEVDEGAKVVLDVYQYNMVLFSLYN